MMGHVNKTDKLDANGLATLLRIGSLPTVWLPPAVLRDQRELPRTRMAFCTVRTSLKNRIHSLLAKYALSPEDGSQLFSQRGRAWLDGALSRLPPETARCLSQHLQILDFLCLQVAALEARIHEQIALTPSMQLLKTLPGVADILAIVIDRDIGTICRFPSAPQFSSYSGTTPRVSSSGGKTRYGRMRMESNQYLKWPSSKLPMRSRPIMRNEAGRTVTSRSCTCAFARKGEARLPSAPSLAIWPRVLSGS
jgi:transposase